MKRFALLFFLFPLCVWTQQQYTALRTTAKIAVDAKMNEEVWTKADSTQNEFITIRPIPALKSEHRTTVRMVYDDFALYFFVTCFDVKDSISKVFTVRDDYNANADIFSIFMDTYNDHQNGFYFGITSTGVQLDGKILSGDVNDQLNLVWESQVRISDNAWLAELKIPYSALRFSKQEVQSWNVNFGRQIARTREESSWVTVNPDFENFLVNSAPLKGISNINPPLRLSLIPYLSGYVNQEEHGFGRSFFGGMDVKYGINEAFTLDVTLVPDFGQVIYDNQVLNTSPFEIQFNENRQFFTEGMELFNKSGIFYSRRIGVQAPREVLITNLQNQEVLNGVQGMPQLYNASKFSGRTKKGLGIGIFNALSAPTVGTAFNTVTNEFREFLAAPLTNYNTLVFDQNLKNNSSLTLTNTNVLREGIFYDANVTALNANLNTKDNKFFLNGRSAVSQKYAAIENELGYNLGLSAGKQRGNLIYSLNYFEEDDQYDPNDLGFNPVNNRRFVNAFIGYRYFKPWWKFVRMTTNVSLSYNRLYRPNVYTESNLDWSAFAMTKHFDAYGVSAYTSFTEKYDYFEPRVWGSYFVVPRWYGAGGWISTNYQKPLAVDANFYYVGFAENPSWKYLNYMLSPRIRASNKILVTLNWSLEDQRNERGYAVQFGAPVDTVSGILFGERNRMNLTQYLEFNYTLNNRMNIALRTRHYWSVLSYSRFFTLAEDGSLAPNATLGLTADGSSAYDLNYNAFTVDCAYRWVFKQGSELSLVWKSAIFTSGNTLNTGYLRNMDDMFNAGLTNNSFSIKLLYWLDVAELKKLKSRQDTP
ncbi:MAG: carbohydrate binding family 9 domain-containing protein [Crocinitomicaceae bacterium]|nr:carbohydrate binding family 9 domain-containing protein [Crocinitomicaceae bacterium]